MSSPDYGFWDLIGPPPGSSGALSARVAFPELYDRQLAAVDSQRRRHYLIPLADGDESLTDLRSRGISVRTEELRVRSESEDEPPVRYIDVLCMDPSLYDGFDLIGHQIAETVSSGAVTNAEAVSRVLSRWRYFWGRGATQLLTRSEVIGLFSELWFLLNWLLPYNETESVISAWRGPVGGRHDFEWTNQSVEVKGTTSVHGRRHWIHGLEQLSPPENGRLLLFSLQIREENGGSNTLPGLILNCRDRLEGNVELLDAFDGLLAESGYSPVHDTEYSRLRFRIVSQALYNVEGLFPRITGRSFGEGLASGVTAVDYEITLDGFDEYIEANLPRRGLF